MNAPYGPGREERESPTWDKIPGKEMEPRVLLEFMMLMGMTKQRRIATDLVDSWNADMERGMDIKEKSVTEAEKVFLIFLGGGL